MHGGVEVPVGRRSLPVAVPVEAEPDGDAFLRLLDHVAACRREDRQRFASGRHIKAPFRLWNRPVGAAPEPHRACYTTTRPAPLPAFCRAMSYQSRTITLWSKVE